MEVTISNYKRKASELGEGPPTPGPAPPQPRPFDLQVPNDSDDESDVEPSAVNDEMERGMIDDDIDLSSFFFHNVLDDAAKSRSQALPALKMNMLPAKTSSKAVSKASDWESW
ncbi:hypothetical protein PAXINDRAFT_16590 [Paxillus involutus ATCC 200175]|uniref:Uncharacterized protein n=1 Tax=Paxillus involutus ATCC 200175 TaxID=664439 RepID=A0A0C9SRG4_PAXIN|nr:hypothetical protein PAXINDRAFT_16590 [Paxillus involutus ATCC 200175]